MIQRFHGTKTQILVDITDAEKTNVRNLARSKGMTLSGYLGQLIKRELANAEETGDAR